MMGWRNLSRGLRYHSPMPLTQIVSITAYPLSIPLRSRVTHAAASRAHADPIVMRVELADGTVGFGETLVREYLTGENEFLVMETIEQEFVPALVDCRPESFPEALERIDALPLYDQGGRVAAGARAGLELALLDAYSRAFRRPMSELAGWSGLPGLGTPGSLPNIRYACVLASADAGKVRRTAALGRMCGLTDFKLKVGFDDDVTRIRGVAEVLGRGLGRTRTLRLDANGGWTLARATEVMGAVRDVPIVCVEQPLARGADEQLPEFHRRSGVAVMPDESLITESDARRLVGVEGVRWFNLRVAKNGGLLPTMKLASFARRRGLEVTLGCLVGETSVLSAAGRRLLEVVPGIRQAEGSYGPLLLREDVTDRPVRFGFGGRGRALSGAGLGVTVEPSRVKRLCAERAREFRL